jgi:hypothetical protein
MVGDSGNNVASESTDIKFLSLHCALHRGKSAIKSLSVPDFETCLDNCLPARAVPSCQWESI